LLCPDSVNAYNTNTHTIQSVNTEIFIYNHNFDSDGWITGKTPVP